jgi:hypothetical protein
MNNPNVTVNTLKIYEDSDFINAKRLCDTHDQWLQVYRRKATLVWTRKAHNSEFDMIKVVNSSLT